MDAIKNSQLFSIKPERNFNFVSRSENKDDFIVTELNAADNFSIDSLLKPNALTVLIVTSGSIRVVFDQHNHIVEANSIIRTIPEHFIRFKETSPDFRGKAISINRDLLNLTTTGFSPTTYLYIRQHPIIELTKDEIEEFLELFHLIKKKYQRINSSVDQNVFHCLVLALYFELAGCVNKRIAEKPEILLSHKEHLYKKFLILLQENIRKEHSVTFYANQLCLTSQYISSVLKELTGMSANKWIDEMLLAEAKMLLFSTENNIQQIADKLNFPDQSSFGKFFKKMTGMSPSNYKKQQKI